MMRRRSPADRIPEANTRRRFILPAGPMLLLLTAVLAPPVGMSAVAWRVAGLAAWMALWWLTAIIPLEATALLPIVLLPLLMQRPIGEVTASYADPIIFLFLGGFFLAATLERWDLHKRFALAAVRIAGTDAARVLLAFMLASAFLSMWISNTATAVMMLPIATAVTSGIGRSTDGPDAPHSGLPVALLLGVAYSCSIGGVATLIGTPPNAIFAGAARQLLDIDMGFGRWMGLGLMVSVPMLAGCWFLLVRLCGVKGHVPELDEMLEREGAMLGPLAGAEKYILAVFIATASAWVFRAPKLIGDVRIPGLADLVPGLTDTGIAIGAALLLFVIPLPQARYGVALNWESAKRVPWGILLLFGGGLALAAGFAESGLTEWIGGRLQGLQGAPTLVIYLVTAAMFVFLTELTSNTATAALGMPLIAGAAGGLGVEPLPLMAVAAIASSMAFRLPVATPPNAIVFGSGRLQVSDMMRAGWWLNVAAIFVITFAVALWV
ncbi:MAG: DASS family sodium-coupled anion symporter [Gemmatimonadetes bacterium]|nr:DASS family sodium-coupled anion symporter [Gemmatimonadota bacterium]